MSSDVSRREFLATVAAAHGAFVLGFWMPDKSQAQTPSAKPSGAVWYEDPATPEVNAWIVVAPDETVTIRIAQTELGQGVWTSNAMMVAEELQCPVRLGQPRRAREGARVDAEGAWQRRHRSNERR
jgi:isoquinoline 1-oxidoreductase beta subunit